VEQVPKPDVSRGAFVITGAASGIGAALVARLLAEDAFVCACDVDATGLERLGKADRLISRVVDVRDREALQSAVDEAGAAAGAIEGLLACAAVFEARSFLDLDEDTWDQTFAINLKGTLFAVQAVLPAMRQRKRGAIVLFSSTLARSGAADGAHYAATKGGVLGLARSVALETASEGIRVNVLSPGVTDTPQPRGNMTEQELFSRAAAIPLGRIGQTSDMVEAALFLLSDEASFMTGQDLRVTGGARLF
jgi:NAD(P)-dependent dehydrogenase (short-subunit alcohol dehydrogenase family)